MHSVEISYLFSYRVSDFYFRKTVCKQSTPGCELGVGR